MSLLCPPSSCQACGVRSGRYVPTTPRWLRLVVSVLWGLGILYGLPQGAMGCTGRTVLNKTSGTITDGPGKYPPSAHCEWLIEAGSPDKSIQLVFESMHTECSYDYLFIYDGNSYSDRLMGSFSGSTKPNPILATSGYMLIYFYSDRNYVLEGFKASYTITDCPFNCSGNGQCDVPTHKCHCYSGFSGTSCDIPVCPHNCLSHGTCDMIKEKCTCEQGYTGMDCSLATNSSDGQSTWYQLAPEGVGFGARTGHAGAFIARSNSLYIFGGNTLNSLLNDLVQYDFSDNTWRTVNQSTSVLWPRARQAHAIVTHGEDFYMYGGLYSDGAMSNELWLYETQAKQWRLKATTSTLKAPQVASHTLTLVENWLYLFGGRTAKGEFLSDIHRIAIPTATEWEKVEARGGKLADRRLVGHSTIYHPQSKSLLVFGGFSPDYARFPKRTDFLHAYNIEKNYWTQVYYDVGGETDRPKDRAFHTATLMDNYMVVYGGNCHIHHDEEICYDHHIHFYHLGCHRWVSNSKMEEAFPGKSESVSHRGRFSHVAVAAYGNTLLISGGYSGSVLGDLVAYTMPTSIAKNWDDPTYKLSNNHCENHTDYDFCKEDPECIWCMELPTPTANGLPAGCIHRSQDQICLKEVRYGKCPGICSALHDCASCTVQGQGAQPGPGPMVDMWHNERCAWCVKAAACQKIDVPTAACDSSYSTSLMVPPWWGRNSSRPQTVEQCRLEDYPAGLHWVRYRHPMDVKHPDNVEIVRKTGLTFQFEPLFDSENLADTVYISKFEGFIYPMGAESSNGPPLKVFLVSVAADAKLYLSTDTSENQKELIAELRNGGYVTKQARRNGIDEQVFPNENPPHKYYMEQVAQQEVAGPKVTQVASNMQLEWTGALREPSRIRQEFTAEFLEPYNNDGSCSNSDSCLGCMTNTACGWCPSSRRCTLKSDVSGGAESCGPVDGAHFLVSQALDCAVCADYISCDTCTQDSLCEWLSHEARCLRRGRFEDAVRNVSLCPVPCRNRTSCTSCLSERNECAWCEQTQTCFPFVEYTMSYSYGGCTQWVDSMSEQQCHDCQRHNSCAECMSEYQCGWCGNVDNPTLGRCLHGDFTGPESGSTCSVLVSEVTNISDSEPAAWSYGVCPDVHECRLGLHDCHVDAACTNTWDSYICTCNRGFTGNGKDVCNRTCYYDCAHGHCSGPPYYNCICDVGWTGNECNVNCGCNNHSTCDTGVGVCDKCQHWSTGDHCQYCRPGAYGDATTTGCIPCNCNGHGDQAEGVCNSTTGKCFCRDNTEGDNCQLCKTGYYGDPSNGERCYLRCEGRTILGNITSGALGSHAGNGVKNMAHAYCLWILTIHPDLTNLRLVDHVPTITFTMEIDIKTLCSRDYVYVYDGIPSFMTSGSRSNAVLLAAYCGYNYDQPVRVEAKSGYLTVYFEGNIEPSSSSTRGFNATYRVNSCVGECYGNRECVEDRCACKPGFGGIDCNLELCPHNCSSAIGQGTCNLALGQCVCSEGFGGPACDVIMSDRVGMYSSVYDPWRVKGYEAFNSSLSRMGHSLVACGNKELYMFGGYSLSRGLLNDLWKYDLETGVWSMLQPATSDQPKPRYFHAAVCVITTRAMYVYGGLTEKGGAVKEMWKFSLDSKRWSQLPITDPDEDKIIPPMAGHTMTLVDQTKIYVIGGFSYTNYFSEKVYEYDASNNKWNQVALEGAQPTGLYGHSAVYHSATDALYVFGGYEYQTDKTAISGSLYVIDLVSRVWSLLPSEESNAPTERAFHAAISTPKYMVVLGGRTNHDFDSSAYAYRYSCNHWTDVTEGTDVYGEGIPAVIGPAAVTTTDGQFNDIYFMGGFNGLSHGSLVKLTLPYDLCTLSQNERACLNQLGCAACIDEDTNITYCYTNEDPTRFDCAHGTSWRFAPGTVCDIQRIEQRECNQHRTCTECLALWPTYHSRDKVCQWCSNCAIGKCIHKGKDCQRENVCERQQRVIKTSKDCVERLCQASDCDKCADLGSCIWTRQFKRSSEVGRTLSLIPIYDWNCVVKSLLEATPYQVQSSPPNACPQRCHQYKSCKTCIKAVGGEGGSQECVWSVPMQECMPPAYLHLRCSNGECGLILTGQADQCPQNCSIHTQCFDCLATPGCGWCAIGGLNGLGVCMEGGLTGPHVGVCSGQNLSVGTEQLPELLYNWTMQSVGAHIWSFGQCLPENECLNGHHNCDKSENCTDLQYGFRCDCKLGYARDSSHKCKPDCKQQCRPNGDCVAPNKCQCHFGYVGHNCSTECQCNKHSDCKTVTERGHCLACQNNTKGTQCQECKPLYVGDPRNGGRCKSCADFCYNHSEVCLSHDQYHIVVSLGNEPQLKNLSMMMDHGPNSEQSAICIGCRGNTQGDRCQECKSGHFRSPKKFEENCEKCKCNGHSDMCDRDSGVNCDCKNNTKSPRCDASQQTGSSSKQCYEMQCSECVDGFLGKPTENHQCYRQMTVDREYCTDPITQMNCNLDPSPLYQGRSVFFAVQPKYLNVDIRITLDVTVGALDLFFSPYHEAFTITVDENGFHHVAIDSKFGYEMGNHQHLRVTREARPPPTEENSDSLNNSDPRGERSLVNGNQTLNSSSTPSGQTIYTYEEIMASDFNTFIKLMHKDVFLRVRDVQNRLVITLPQGVHALKVSQFYLILLGKGGPTSNATYGNLFFRQDQPHIDLFVFFSVFFSCFFLFLAKCVFLWKIKQAMDAQRSRHRLRLEMQHLASRPFSRVKIIIDPDPADHPQMVQLMSVNNTTSTPLPRKGAIPKPYSKYSITSDSFDFSPLGEEKFSLKPLALEPTDDGVAAIGTFFFQLPGGPNTPMHACLGSCLIQSSRVLFPSSHQNKSVYIRRQPSSSA